MPPVSDLAAGGVVSTFPATIPLLAGEAPLISADFILDTGNLAKFTVLGKITATGKVVQLNPAGSDGSEVAFGVLAQPADASGGDVSVPVYTGGFFNHAALVWPAALDTLVERQVAFDGSPIQIGKVSLS